MTLQNQLKPPPVRDWKQGITKQFSGFRRRQTTAEIVM